ncbi:MAG: T9SS type A sorting domain-containing protein, partial [Candidatus Heimdallarchaeota archaeon]|nr:T9SS type A sorting domain-containing protein [Candidatus Heimdallarchaeota archaeon]
SAHLAYHEVFDGDPFPAAMSQTGMPGPFDLMKGTSKAIFLNLMAMHYNDDLNTFVDEAELEDGTVEQGDKVTTKNVAYALVALKQFAEEFSGTPLQDLALLTIKKQSNFLLSHLRSGRGSFYASYSLKEKRKEAEENVEAQAAAIRGLYAAYQATNRDRYLRAANRAYEYLIENYYVAGEHVFRTEMDEDEATSTPEVFAIITGALREAALVGDFSEAPAIYTHFFKKIANKMQLSEGAESGEFGNDSDGDGIPYIPEQPDNLPPVFASEAVYEFSDYDDIDEDEDEDEENEQKENIAKLRNFPNPFNPTTTIQYEIPKECHVELIIYDILGRKINTLQNDVLNPGLYKSVWDGIDDAGNHVSSGIYIYQIQAGESKKSNKMMLMR